MKTNVILLIGACIALGAFAQSDGDKILGKWVLQERHHVVEFVKNGSQYEGFIREAEHPSVINVKQIASLKYDKGSSYKGGTFYVIRKDKKIDCSAELAGDTLMELSVTHGLFSKTILWKRVEPDSTAQ
jgi:uncharacterized protein (DUF2147 family)